MRGHGHHVVRFLYSCSTHERKSALIFSGAETLSENIFLLPKQNMIAVKFVFHGIIRNRFDIFTRTLYCHHALSIPTDCSLVNTINIQYTNYSKLNFSEFLKIIFIVLNQLVVYVLSTNASDSDLVRG